MKKNLFFLIAIGFILVETGCTNSANNTSTIPDSTSTRDTTLANDSVKGDPDAPSDPH